MTKMNYRSVGLYVDPHEIMVIWYSFSDTNFHIFFCCRDSIIEPAAIFAMLFGSELFEEYIGQLAMASMASLDIFTEGEQFDAKKLQEKMRVQCPSISWIGFSDYFSFIITFCAC